MSVCPGLIYTKPKNPAPLPPTQPHPDPLIAVLRRPCKTAPPSIHRSPPKLTHLPPPSPSSARKPVPPQRPTTPTKAPRRLRFPSAHCFVARRHPDLQHQQPAGEDPARQHDHARQRQDPEDPTLLDID